MALRYSHNLHLHNYACWTAARAAQRRFPGAKTHVVQKVLEYSNFPKRLKTVYRADPTPAQYDRWHKVMVAELKGGFKQEGVAASYGQVAKVIAVYIKTIYILRYSDSVLAQVAHPPIDRTLLQNISACKETAAFEGSISWTKFDKEDYFTAVDYLRREGKGRPFWSIERYWKG